ncbi:MAG: TonB-dependent receptor, partial [Cyclobacteriaceae bacterium]|nr:TonB-dependent receptor [Cyclobacteriaceae bacterium]
MIVRVYILVFFSLLWTAAFAQDDWDVPWIVVGDSAHLMPKQDLIITGKISNSVSGEAVTGASISAETFKYFDYSDQNGHYVLELPPGKYRVMVRHVGMKAVYLRLVVLSAGLLNIKMEEGTTGLDVVVITSRALDSNIKQSLPGLTTFNIQEIRTLPTLMGEVDILKSLQLMPGVSSVGEGSSGFNVRGGRMDQNLVLLNDVPLFNSSHALGFVSAFNQDIVKSFSLYKGNVPANYGGRASSVLEISTRRGDFEKWQFQGGVGPITSRVLAEGPITNKTSVLLSGRISHANWALEKAADPNVKRSKLSFYDAYVGLSQRISANSTADLTFYSSQDDFRYSQQFGYSWNNYVINGKWTALADRKASPTLSVSYGHYRSALIDPAGIDASELTNTMNYLQFSENINYTPDEKHTIVAGLSGTGYFPKAEELNGYGGNVNIRKQSAEKNSGVELSI